MSDEDANPRPALRIVRGRPSAEDVAVLTALLAAGSGADEAGDGTGAAQPIRGGWRDPSRQHRSTLIAGPNAWRSSAW